jgi:ZIP family zinc transporter
MSEIIIFLVLSVIGPLIGAILGIIRYPSKRFIVNMLAFAAGVMLSVSFINLIPQSIKFSSNIITVIGIITGATLMFLIDRFVPHLHPEKEYPNIKDKNMCDMTRSSRYITIGLFIHNIPEGMVIALGTISSVTSGTVIALAIALQKIPEGICTAAPTFYCTGNRFKAFLISCASIIPLILGFILAYFLYQHVSDTIIGLIIGVTAGFMIYISADELIPASSKRISNHTTIASLIVGVIFVILMNSIQ